MQLENVVESHRTFNLFKPLNNIIVVNIYDFRTYHYCGFNKYLNVQRTT
jgi:hypothetical protein